MSFAVEKSKAGLTPQMPTQPRSLLTEQHLLLNDLLERTATSHLEPFAFFISWHGVLTLAYRGFTPALVDLKQRISAAHPALPQEAPGSLWPKTTLGCLNDGVTLTIEQFYILNDVCK